MIASVHSRLVREKGGRFFDSASLAAVPEPLERQASKLLPQDWDAMIGQARHSFGQVLAPEEGVIYSFEPDAHITLFTNTTTAFTRVLSRIEKAYAGSEPTLLTTDLEYPGCLAAIDDGWSGPVVMTRVSRSLIGTDDPDQVLAEALVRAHNFVKPRVVFVSHVVRTTGQVLSPVTLRNLRELNPRVIIVLDGSQAVGNVVVSAEMLEEADFYVASGHKWLGGSTTSGFAWVRDPDRWTVADPAQAYGKPNQLGGTGNSTAWASLIGSIEDMVEEAPRPRLEEIAAHNRALGKAFKDALAPVSPQIEFVTPLEDGVPPSGLFTLGLRLAAGERVVAALNEAEIRFTEFDAEIVSWRSPEQNRFLLKRDSGYSAIARARTETATIPKRARSELRFCFHYWHSEEDVLGLARAIIGALQEGAASPPAPSR